MERCDSCVRRAGAPKGTARPKHGSESHPLWPFGEDCQRGYSKRGDHEAAQPGIPVRGTFSGEPQGPWRQEQGQAEYKIHRIGDMSFFQAVFIVRLLTFSFDLLLSFTLLQISQAPN